MVLGVPDVCVVLSVPMHKVNLTACNILSFSLQKLGIQKRHRVAENETASDLAFAAATKLFECQPGLRALVDHLLFCAQEVDYYTPSTAVVLQHKLALPQHISAMDYNHGCSGFTYGLFLAKSMLKSSDSDGVLLLTGYSASKIIHPGDRSSKFLFGDAGTATLIGRELASRIGHFVFKTKGDQYETIIVRDGFGRNPLGPSSFVEEEDEFGNKTAPAFFSMNGTKVFSFAVRTIPTVVKEILDRNQCLLKDIDLFLFHQANVFLLETIAKKIDIPRGKLVIDISQTGNTGQSSIAIALCHLQRNQNLSGKKVMVIGFGTGLSVAGTIINY